MMIVQGGKMKRVAVKWFAIGMTCAMAVVCSAAETGADALPDVLTAILTLAAR